MKAQKSSAEGTGTELGQIPWENRGSMGKRGEWRGTPKTEPFRAVSAAICDVNNHRKSVPYQLNSQQSSCLRPPIRNNPLVATDRQTVRDSTSNCVAKGLSRPPA